MRWTENSIYDRTAGCATRRGRRTFESYPPEFTLASSRAIERSPRTIWWHAVSIADPRTIRARGNRVRAIARGRGEMFSRRQPRLATRLATPRRSSILGTPPTRTARVRATEAGTALWGDNPDFAVPKEPRDRRASRRQPEDLNRRAEVREDLSEDPAGERSRI